MRNQKPTPKKRRSLSVTAIKTALRENYGNISQSARTLQCDRCHLSSRVNADPELATVRDEARETLVDIAEDALLRKIRDGDTASIIFTLKSQGKQRGWSENPRTLIAQQNVTHTETAAERIERWREML